MNLCEAIEFLHEIAHVAGKEITDFPVLESGVRSLVLHVEANGACLLQFTFTNGHELIIPVFSNKENKEQPENAEDLNAVRPLVESIIARCKEAGK